MKRFLLFATLALAFALPMAQASPADAYTENATDMATCAQPDAVTAADQTAATTLAAFDAYIEAIAFETEQRSAAMLANARNLSTVLNQTSDTMDRVGRGILDTGGG